MPVSFDDPHEVVAGGNLHHVDGHSSLPPAERKGSTQAGSCQTPATSHYASGLCLYGTAFKGTPRQVQTAIRPLPADGLECMPVSHWLPLRLTRMLCELPLPPAGLLLACRPENCMLSMALLKDSNPGPFTLPDLSHTPRQLPTPSIRCWSCDKPCCSLLPPPERIWMHGQLGRLSCIRARCSLRWGPDGRGDCRALWERGGMATLTLAGCVRAGRPGALQWRQEGPGRCHAGSAQLLPVRREQLSFWLWWPFQLAFLHEWIGPCGSAIRELHGSTAGDNRIHSGLWVAEGRA